MKKREKELDLSFNKIISRVGCFSILRKESANLLRFYEIFRRYLLCCLLEIDMSVVICDISQKPTQELSLSLLFLALSFLPLSSFCFLSSLFFLVENNLFKFLLLYFAHFLLLIHHPEFFFSFSLRFPLESICQRCALNSGQ